MHFRLATLPATLRLFAFREHPPFAMLSWSYEPTTPPLRIKTTMSPKKNKRSKSAVKTAPRAPKKSPSAPAAAPNPSPAPVKMANPIKSPRLAKPSSTFVPREAIESLLVAILLALLFRGFEAEAFIIPTGSMAPALSGRHKDLTCPECGYQYRVGAAQELSSSSPIRSTTCPMCRFRPDIDPSNANHKSFNGDRILVNKYIYQFTDPKRWDVIVFKFPGNAKQNYIKRLVGLPNETIRIAGGDVYSKPDGENDFTIQRKPAKKLPYIMHVVHDTRYIPEKLVDVNWPARWQDRGPQSGNIIWQVGKDRNLYSLKASQDTRWLGYRHLVPDFHLIGRMTSGRSGLPNAASEWQQVRSLGKLPDTATQRLGGLITDFYEYNSAIYRGGSFPSGWHWVGDLACEAIIDVTESSSGTLSLRLVEGGLDHVFEVDVATGKATVSIEGGQLPFDALNGESRGPQTLSAKTPIRGKGSYRVMWANVDNQLLLWVNRKLIQLEDNGTPHPGYFTTKTKLTPHWTPEDDGDLTPIAVGGKDVSLEVRNLRVLRDVYYVASSYRQPARRNEYMKDFGFMQIQDLFHQPNRWAETELFETRNEVEFAMGPDEFFPMGDNSPHSKDARLWSADTTSLFLDQGIAIEPSVDREMLIGKAFLVYWPHTWSPKGANLPILPNLDRMGFIR